VKRNLIILALFTHNIYVMYNSTRLLLLQRDAYIDWTLVKPVSMEAWMFLMRSYLVPHKVQLFTKIKNLKRIQHTISM
jgi:hypothetical protein